MDTSSTFASRKTKRPLHPSLAADALEDMKRKKYAKNTGKKYNWACNAYNEWCEQYLDNNIVCCDDVVLSNLHFPTNLEKRRLCKALCKFITEVKKHNSDDYPPQSIKGLIIAIQMYLKTNKVNWRLLNENDDVFVDLFNVVNNVM